MKIFFRADGNKNIGWGHVMRSISIASAFRKTGSECVFVCADTAMVEVLDNYDFEHIVLNTDYTQMESEIDQFSEIIIKHKPDILFVDSYFVTYNYLSACKNLCKTVYIDDVYSFPYPVDVLINYNVYADKEKYLELYKEESNIPKFVLGLSYVPLREEFKGIEYELRTVVKNVFVSTGGSDEAGLVLKLINVLLVKEEMTKGTKYHFILGSFEPDREEIYKLEKKYEWIVVHEKVKRMSEIMSISDIAISASGSTLYELCACGIPTITYILADNQIEGATTFEKKGLMINAGDLREKDFSASRIDKLEEIYFSPEKRTILHNKIKSFVDGNGSDTIVEYFICSNKGGIKSE